MYLSGQFQFSAIIVVLLARGVPQELCSKLSKLDEKILLDRKGWHRVFSPNFTLKIKGIKFMAMAVD